MGEIGPTAVDEHRSSVEKYEMFVDGERKKSTKGRYIDIETPYAREVWASVPRGTEQDVDDAVRSARDAFQGEWKEFQPSQRRRLLDEIASAVEDHTQELATLETKENGRTITDMEAELRAIPEWFRYYGSLCHVQEGQVPSIEAKSGDMFNYVVNEPYGVIGAITPWNAPLLVTTMKIAPALAAGNTVVQKPSEHTPVSALRFAEIIYEETDIPDGVYNVVTGYGDEAGAPLVSHSGVNKVGFTGSVATGREVATEAVDNLHAVTLELGGKNPNIVFPDADLDNAVNAAMKGVFGGSGQICTAASRLIVHEDIVEDFVEVLSERIKGIAIGDPMDRDTDIGPIAFDNQCNKVETHVEEAMEDGAEVVIGGSRIDEGQSDLFFEPTILTEVESDMTIAQDETFGPVASILPFSDEAEAIHLANDVDYGLVAGIWTEDMRRAHRMSNEIEAGTIWVNEYRYVSYKSPYGGYGISGLGKENGREGLKEFQKKKSIWFDISGEVPDPFDQPAVE